MVVVIVFVHELFVLQAVRNLFDTTRHKTISDKRRVVWWIALGRTEWKIFVQRRAVLSRHQRLKFSIPFLCKLSNFHFMFF